MTKKQMKDIRDILRAQYNSEIERSEFWRVKAVQRFLEYDQKGAEHAREDSRVSKYTADIINNIIGYVEKVFNGEYEPKDDL